MKLKSNKIVKFFILFSIIKATLAEIARNSTNSTISTNNATRVEIANNSTNSITLTNSMNITNSSNSTQQNLKLSLNDDTLIMQEILRTAKAAEIQSYIDENINPCNDFYQFACSKFPKFHPAKSGGVSNVLKLMADALKEKIEKFLNTPETDTDTALDRKMKRFYISCMKIKLLTQADYKSKLMAIIADFGKMPVLSSNGNGSDWDEKNFDWIAMVAQMQRQYAKPALLQLDVAPDFRDLSVNCLYIGQPKMLFDSKAMYNDNATALYRDIVIATIAQRLEKYLSVPKDLARKTAFEIMAFEIALSQGMWEGKMEMEKMNSPTTIKEWNEKYDLIIDVERLINLTVGPVKVECIYESIESFQVNLRHVLTNVPKRVVANYLFYMLLADDFMVRSERSVEAQKKVCRLKMATYFNKALDNMIYRHYDTKKTELDMKLIYEQLKLSLRNKFADSDDLDWMNAKARFNAIEKLDKTRFEINSHADDNSTYEFDMLAVTTTNYLENVKNLLQVKGRKYVQSFYEAPKPSDAAAVLSFSPANLIQENRIVTPVATLQPYFLWADVYPNSVKFGNLGTMLGHELLHSFDDEGRKYDKNGNQFNWWDLDSIQAFHERAKCLVDQYSKYKFGDYHLRGDFLLSENIADNGGLKLAYDAYILWCNQSTTADLKRETFTQLKYTNTQLFFISFAQLWCSDISENVKNLITATDTHAPNVYRVKGSLSNLPEFSAAFKCRKGTPMNPVNKCKVY